MVAAAARGSIVNMFTGPHPGIREGAVRTDSFTQGTE